MNADCIVSRKEINEKRVQSFREASIFLFT